MTEKQLRKRTDVLNLLVERFGYQTYLEIGLRSVNRNLGRVRCPIKHSVDPDPFAKATFVMPSDAFFASHEASYDIIFIDGLHTEEQVDRDIAAALERLNAGGTIVLHDCNPPTEWHQRPQKAAKGDEEWNGAVWRSYAKLRMTRSDLFQCVVDVDYGVGIIRRGRQDLFPVAPIAYALLDSQRRRLLRLVEPTAQAVLRAIEEQ
jgi:hypothetical protein